MTDRKRGRFETRRLGASRGGLADHRGAAFACSIALTMLIVGLALWPVNWRVLGQRDQRSTVPTRTPVPGAATSTSTATHIATEAPSDTPAHKTPSVAASATSEPSYTPLATASAEPSRRMETPLPTQCNMDPTATIGGEPSAIVESTVAATTPSQKVETPEQMDTIAAESSERAAENAMTTVPLASRPPVLKAPQGQTASQESSRSDVGVSGWWLAGPAILALAVVGWRLTRRSSTP